MTRIPLEILDQHVAVLGKTRSGKSSVMRWFVEGLLDKGKPVCVIDPKGDWWGLKSSADGKSAGYPVVIFGGEHADVPINAHSGGPVAELVATGNRPCIIDLGGWMVGERTRFFIDFASMLFRHSRGLRWLVIDEVHNFAPQAKVHDVDSGKMVHWANRLASEGLGKGIQLMAASQRPQKVHKDLVTSCETLIAMRVTHPLDRQAMKKWIDGCDDPTKGEEVLTSLASMPRGTGWVWSPEIGFGPTKVAFQRFRTYDSFRPAKATDARLLGWASVDLDEVKVKLDAVVKEVQANDPKLLRQKIADLERQMREAAARGMVADPKAIETARREGEDAAWAGIAHWLRSLDAQAVAAVVQDATDRARTAAERIGPLLDALRHGPPRKEAAYATPQVRHQPPQAVAPQARRVASSHPPQAQVKGETLPAADRAFLTVLAQQGRALTRNQIAIFAGYSSKSGHVDNTLGALRTRGFAVGGRDAIAITDAGRSALGSFDPLPRGEALRDYWFRKLDKAASAFLRALCESYPATMTRDQLADRTSYSRESGHVDNTLSALRSRDLVTGGRHEIRASDDLFG